MANVPFTCAKGEPGAIVALDGERIELVSERPEAPGSRPVYRLADGAEVRIKVHGCKREGVVASADAGASDGAGSVFRIDGRVIDLTRALRERLTAALATVAVMALATALGGCGPRAGYGTNASSLGGPPEAAARGDAPEEGPAPPGVAKELAEYHLAIFARLHLAFGRIAFIAHDDKTAREHFEQVDSKSRWCTDAKTCLAVTRTRGA